MRSVRPASAFKRGAAAVVDLDPLYFISTNRLASALSSRTRLRICSISAVRRPCVVWAARIRARPSGVRGPVLSPPCRRQRRRFFIAGDWHGLPLRVRAPQRGQDCANGSVVRQSGRRSAGFLAHFGRTPSPRSPRGCDVSDNGLPSWMDVNVFDTDNLLTTFTAPAIQRREQPDECA
jgi:hypothetical protein